MATKKITALVELTAPAVGDFFIIVDISEALDVDKNKKIAVTNIGNMIPTLENLINVGFASVHDNGNSGAAKTIDWATNGNLQKVTLTGNCTFTFTAPNEPGHQTLIMLGDATQRTLTWPATVIWVGPIGEPVWSGSNGNKNIMSMLWDGADYIASGAEDGN